MVDVMVSSTRSALCMCVYGEKGRGGGTVSAVP